MTAGGNKKTHYKWLWAVIWHHGDWRYTGSLCEILGKTEFTFVMQEDEHRDLLDVLICCHISVR
jgi:hypothetical protein